MCSVMQYRLKIKNNQTKIHAPKKPAVPPKRKGKIELEVSTPRAFDATDGDPLLTTAIKDAWNKKDAI